MLLIAIGLCIGIACAGNGGAALFAGIAISLLVLVISAIFRYKPGMVIAVALICGLVRFCIAVPQYKSFSGENNVIRGTVYRIYKEQLVIDDFSVNNTKVKGRLLIPLKTDMRVGDRIFCMGSLSPSSKQFTENYLLSSGILYVAGDVESVAKTGENRSLHSAIAGVRDFLHERIGAIFGDGADFARAILLGETTSIDSDEMWNIRTAGIAHIFALSGLHVSLIASTLEFLLYAAGKKARLCITAVLLVFYAAVVGFPASFVRAVIAVIIRTIAVLCKKRYDPLNALAFAAVFLLAVNPYTLFTAGFILSFGTVLMILFVSKPLRGLLIGDTRFRIMHSAAQSVSASLGITPLSAAVFGKVALYALPVNIICIPVVSTGAMIAFAGLIAGIIYVPLSVPFAFAANTLFAMVRDLSGVIALLPLAVIKVNGMSWIAVLACFAAGFATSDYLIAERKIKIWTTAAFVILGIIFIIS